MIWWLLGALAVGALIYLGVTLTVAVIRNFRTRHNTKVLVADMETFIRSMPDKEKHAMSFEDFENCRGKQFVSEFDPYTDEVIKTRVCDMGMDAQVQYAVNSHGGYIIVGD